MPVYNFDRIRYKSELLIDCVLLSDKEGNLLEHSPCKTELHEIYFIINGTGKFYLNNNSIPFKAGSIIFIAPNRWRQWKELSEDTEAYVLIFREDFMSNYFHDQLFLYRFHYFYNESLPSYLYTSSSEKDELLAITLKIYTELKHIGVDSKHYLRSLLYHLLILLNRKYKRDFNVETELLNNTQASIFKKLLENKIQTYKQVSDYTDHMGISKTQLNNIIKKAFGKSVSAIIKSRRIAEAKRLILFTNLGIAEISNILNYSEPSNFNRIFKAETNYTPSKYRQLYSN